MKKIKLKKISLKNFMGVKSYEKSGLETGNWEVAGKNGIGKSTLLKGLLWTLECYMPDDFKPHDQDGIEIPGKITECGYIFDINGKEIAFSKTAKDQKDRKTGLKKANSFKYFIDDFECKKNAYVNTIKEEFNVSDNALRLLSQPFGFNQIKWQEFREILTEMIPEISDADFIDHTKFATLKPHMAPGISLDYLIKQLSSQVKKLDKNLSEKQTIIEHETEKLKEVKKPKKTNADAELKELEQKRIVMLADSKNSVKIAEYQAEKTQLESSIKELESEQRLALKEISSNISNIIKDKESYEGIRDKAKEEISGLETKKAKIGTVWKQVHQRKISVSDTCFNCNQSIPELMIDELTAKANNEKAEELKKIEQEGFTLNEQIKRREAARTKLEKSISEKETEIKTLEEEEKKQKANGVDEEIEKLKKRITGIDYDISMAKTKLDNDKEINELQDQIEKLKEEKEQFDSDQRDYEAYQQAKYEIEKLKKDIKNISSSLSLKNQLLDTAKEASRAKYESIETQINDKFETVQIKLFDIPMNGDMRETCKVMVGGVEFNSGLNTAARINADLEIKAAFMKEYDIAFPVFIDNTESVSEPFKLDTQCFYLKVDKDAKELEWREV